MNKTIKQCKYVSEKGTQCKRNSLTGDDYCYLHSNKLISKFRIFFGVFFLLSTVGFLLFYLFGTVGSDLLLSIFPLPTPTLTLTPTSTSTSTLIPTSTSTTTATPTSTNTSTITPTPTGTPTPTFTRTPFGTPPPTNTNTPTPAPPTYTPYPTYTKYPTNSPHPTYTPNPTHTPYPTYTHQPLTSTEISAAITPKPTAKPLISEDVMNVSVWAFGILTTCSGSLIAFIGFVSTTILAWNKELREEKKTKFDYERLRLELDRKKFELEKLSYTKKSKSENHHDSDIPGSEGE